jgi:hypothetical protein
MTLTQFKALKSTIVSISSSETSIKYKNSITYTVSIPQGIIEIDSYRFQKLT